MRSWVHNSVTPRLAPPMTIFVTSILAMVTIFGVDLADGSQIWSQVLYVFPLYFIALSCERFRWVVFAVLLSAVFQLLTFLWYEISALSVIANWIIALAASVMTVGLARVARSRFAEAETDAATDVLTGLCNRRGFESVAAREIIRQKRYGGVFSLVVIDLDRFKSLNDSKGHAAGDRALRLLGFVLRRNLRQTDSIARLGGDEFVIVMPNTQAADCAALCRQLSATIGNQMDAAGFAVTASIGYTTCETPPSSVAAALQEADDAMYAAKAMSSGLASQSRIAAFQIPPPPEKPPVLGIHSDAEDVLMARQKPSPGITGQVGA